MMNRKGNEIKKSTKKVLEDACDFARALGDFHLFDEKMKLKRVHNVSPEKVEISNCSTGTQRKNSGTKP